MTLRALKTLQTIPAPNEETVSTMAQVGVCMLFIGLYGIYLFLFDIFLQVWGGEVWGGSYCLKFQLQVWKCFSCQFCRM